VAGKTRDRSGCCRTLHPDLAGVGGAPPSSTPALRGERDRLSQEGGEGTSYLPLVLGCAIGLLAGLSVRPGAYAHRSPTEGGGDCAQFQFDVPAELAGAMANPVRTVVTLRERAVMDVVSPSRQALTVALHRAGHVQGTAGPKSGGPLPGSHAGLLSAAVPRDGVYRVSVAAPLWMKVFEGQTRVHSQAFEMQTGCDRTFKSFTYRLRAGVTYWIELSSDQQEITLAITPE